MSNIQLGSILSSRCSKGYVVRVVATHCGDDHGNFHCGQEAHCGNEACLTEQAGTNADSESQHSDLAPKGQGHLSHQNAVFFEVGIQLSKDVSCLHVGLG